MALETPAVPTYGPDMFAQLAELVRIVRANDGWLLEQIGQGGGGTPTPVEPEFEAIALASGYGNNTSYVNSRVVKQGTICSMESGVITCPASFSAAVYNTLGSIGSNFRPKDSKFRMGSGLIFRSAGFVPMQWRVNTNGEIQFYSQVAVTGATYLILGDLTWSVA